MRKLQGVVELAEITEIAEAYDPSSPEDGIFFLEDPAEPGAGSKRAMPTIPRR